MTRRGFVFELLYDIRFKAFGMSRILSKRSESFTSIPSWRNCYLPLALCMVAKARFGHLCPKAGTCHNSYQVAQQLDPSSPIGGPDSEKAPTRRRLVDNDDAMSFSQSSLCHSLCRFVGVPEWCRSMLCSGAPKLLLLAASGTGGFHCASDRQEGLERLNFPKPSGPVLYRPRGRKSDISSTPYMNKSCQW